MADRPCAKPALNIVLEHVKTFLLIGALIVISGITTIVLAQQTDTTTQIQVRQADEAEFQEIKPDEFHYLRGNVILYQDSIFMFCDTAIIKNGIEAEVWGNVVIQQNDTLKAFTDSLFYFADLRMADLKGEDVRLIHGDQQLITTFLKYYVDERLATYDQNATMTDGRTQISSKRGSYLMDQELATFKDSVVVVDPEFVLRTDTISFDMTTKRARFMSPTRIIQEEMQLYCESGFYDTDDEYAELYDRAQFQKNDQEGTADTIIYDGIAGTYDLVGNAWYKDAEQHGSAERMRYDARTEIIQLIERAKYFDGERTVTGDTILYDQKSKRYILTGKSQLNEDHQFLDADFIDFDDSTGVGIALGRVIWRDTSEQIAVVSDQAFFTREGNQLLAYGSRRPMLKNVLEGDTLYLTADTLLSSEMTVEQDTFRQMFAYHDVRVFKSNMQIISDSLYYNGKDSIFTFFGDPVVWSDTSQFVADTIHIILKNKAIHRILLDDNAFMINSEDEVYFNQVKGRDITAHFRDGEVHRLNVEGNAQSTYYVLDESKAYIGVNQVTCSEMLVFFGSNKVEGIKFYAEPTAQFIPMKQADHNKLKLEGFRWISKGRPMSIQDLF